MVLRVLVVALALVRAFLVAPWAFVRYVAPALPMVLAVFARLAKVLLRVVVALAVAADGAT
eukprot:7267052-Alexandrium_andersonii.AAC.1